MAVFEHLDTFGKATAIVDGGHTHSYKQLVTDGDTLANAAGARSLVAFIASNSYAAIAAYVGLLRLGAVPLMLPSATSAADLSATLEQYEPTHVYAPQEMAETFGFGEQLNSLEGYGLYGTGHQNPALNDELALLLTTSGSTGSKSLVRLSATNITSNAAQIIDYLGICATDRAVTTMPMSYSYGLSIINSHLLKGATIVATEESFVSTKFWNILKKQKVTTFGGVPFIYEVLKKLRFHKMDLPSLSYITQAGGKLASDLADYFRESCADKGIKFIIMYGQTEATARISYVPADMLEKKSSSVGISVPGGKLWLEDETGTRINAPNMPGELVFEGANVSLGYAACKTDLKKDNENNGILHTGDIAEQDSDGYFRIVGRKKRFLKLYGNRVNLAEVESLLERAGYKVACGGEDDKMRVYLEDSNDITGVRELLKVKTNIPPKGYTVVSIDKIPRSDNGKISYHLLNTDFAAG